jgi:hypothetical protein
MHLFVFIIEECKEEFEQKPDSVHSCCMNVQTYTSVQLYCFTEFCD